MQGLVMHGTFISSVARFNDQKQQVGWRMLIAVGSSAYSVTCAMDYGDPSSRYSLADDVEIPVRARSWNDKVYFSAV